MKVRDTYIKTNGDEEFVTTISGDELKMVKRKEGETDTTLVNLHDGKLELEGGGGSDGAQRNSDGCTTKHIF